MLTQNGAPAGRLGATAAPAQKEGDPLILCKVLALALGALAVSTTLAAAESHFTLPLAQDDDGIAELGRINADGDGVVQVYALDAGRMGALIGSEVIHAGTNADVRVPLTDNPQQDARAVLVVGGQIVATQELRFHG